MHGSSACSVDERVKRLGMRGLINRQVSRWCTEIDERVHALRNGPIEGDWPCL